jgi:hypothetical protein
VFRGSLRKNELTPIAQSCRIALKKPGQTEWTLTKCVGMAGAFPLGPILSVLVFPS